MNEFRKPYEYEEEKRGAILLFVIMLLSVDILMALFYTVQVSGVLKQIPVLRISVLAIGSVYILFTIFTAMICFQLKKTMVRLSKAYLVVRAIFSVISILILFIHGLNDLSKIGKGNQYDSIGNFIFAMLILPLVYVAAVSIGWYLYFLKSKRCKEIVMK